MLELNNDGSLNFFDVSAFLAAFSAHDQIVDMTCDGSYNSFHVSTFLAAFSAGCP
ncbi:MAG: GC-type dockerin domain-anchored protein [Phycisphaerales bacterium]|nr:GC-type dockerin domain-anchored protein [Phycisphaerales bacterium]